MDSGINPEVKQIHSLHTPRIRKKFVNPNKYEINFRVNLEVEQNQRL